MAIAWLSSCCLECLSRCRCHRKVVCAQILKLAKLWHPLARTRSSHIKCSNATTTRQNFPKPAPSADAERERERERKSGQIWRVFILPADDGRGSTFYEAVKKTFATDNRNEGCEEAEEGEEGQTCNFLARSSFRCAAPPDTDAGPRPSKGQGRGGGTESCRP